ncbi:MAG: M48 family metalloprotease [Mariprofundaceae bacterium]|nr:M48 family metalloprotease [Mariprofundaceae bacterium]
MMSLRMYSLALVALLMFSACATNPVSKNQDFVLMSEKQELALGQRYAAEVAKQMPLMPADDPLVKYVNKVGQRVAAVSDRPELFYHFNVVDDTTINAFALPGGHIYIYRGLLTQMNSESELAAVLGHEIGHVTARHAVQRYTQAQGYQLGMAVASIFLPIPQTVGQISNLLASAIIQGYGRKDELQSDELSIKYIAKAGYDVHATTRLLKTLKRLEDIRIKEAKDTTGKAPEIYHGAFSSHPETKERIEEAVAKSSGQQSVLAEVGHNAMLAALDGYPYGDSPEQGAIVGQKFLHPKLGIQLEFPKNWVIKNTPQALTARLRQKKAFFILQLKELSKRRSGEDVLRELFRKRKLEALHTTRRGGFAVTQAIVNTSAKQVGQARVLATAALKGSKAYILTSYSQRAKFEDYRADFEAIARSFRSYDVKRDGDVPRIHLYTWKQGNNWKSLAKTDHNILGRFTADKLAALNGMDLNESPKGGTIIKIVR